MTPFLFWWNIYAKPFSDGSRAFAKKLEGSFELKAMNRAEAENAVRRGQQTGYIVITPGFGTASDRMFYGAPPTVVLGLDPSRKAESGMLEGLLMKYGAQGLQEVFSDPAAGRRAVANAMASLPADKNANSEVASTSSRGTSTTSR